MNCGRFGKLIDSYLDGRLSGSLLAEFHAHRLACRRCMRVVSMLQAAGDVIAYDRSGEPKIGADFTDRVMLALPPVMQKANRSVWLVRLTAGAASLAAAAAISMAVMLAGQAPVAPSTHRSIYADATAGRMGGSMKDTAVLPAVAIWEGAGIQAPKNAEMVLHRLVLSQSGLIPDDNDLLTGNAVRKVVDRVAGYTEYRLAGSHRPR